MILTNIYRTVNSKIETSGFEIVIVLSIILILGVSLYRFITGQSKDGGTWTKKKYYELLPLPEHRERKHIHERDSPPEKKQQGADSKGEIECRRVLQNIFRKPFDKARPNFLNNPVTGGSYNLELDCYDDELKIAVEYNGRQHYEYIPFFHRNKDQFTMQKYRDDMKRRMCKDQGILMIEVPHTTSIKDIESFIITSLRSNNRMNE
jgi:hypothetical protein